MKTLIHKVGDVRFYKYPDLWGSPIERAVVTQVHEGSCTVSIRNGTGSNTLPNYMLFRYACDASEWADREIKPAGKSIFEESNEKLRRSDYDFTMKKPMVQATGSGTFYVVTGNGGSLVLVDSLEAADAVQDWLRRATGQRSTIRAAGVYSSPAQKEASPAPTRVESENYSLREQAVLVTLANPVVRRMIQKLKKRKGESGDFYAEARQVAAKYPNLWAMVVEKTGVLPDIEAQIAKCQQEDKERT